MTAGSVGGFDSGFAAEDGCGDESNQETDGQWLHEGVSHVDEGVLVQLLRPLYGSDLPGDGGGIKSGGLDLVNLCGEVAVHEVGHEVEVEDLPHGDVANGRDQGNQDAAGEGAAERDLAAEDVVTVTADAEVDQQERRHHHGVAENHAVAGADLVCYEKRAAHKDGDHDAGDEPEGKDSLLHVTLLVRVRLLVLLSTDSRCGQRAQMSSSFRV